jgi:hypothetical protein
MGSSEVSCVRRLGLAALVLALPLFLAACGSDSSPDSASPSSTPGLDVAPSSTTAPAATVVEPTTTPAPVPSTQPAPSPTTESLEVAVEGSADFMAWTERALDLIESEAPEWYEQVTQSIAKIIEVEAGSGIFVTTKTYQVGRQTAYAPGYGEAKQLIWYAGTIVHDSCHSERYHGGLVHNGKEGEVACLIDQKAAIQLFDTDAFFASYIQGLIDGADDPANQYWNTPNRHW